MGFRVSKQTLIAACVVGGSASAMVAAPATAGVTTNGLPPTVAPLTASSPAPAGREPARPSTHISFRPGIAVSVGSLPTGVAASDSTAYVTNSDDNTVSVVDLATHTVSNTIPVGRFPAAVALNPADTQAYVTNFRDGTLSIIDLSTDTVTHTVTVDKDPDGVVESGGLVYVASLLSSTIDVVDPSAGNVTSRIALSGSSAPAGLAASTNGQAMYVDDARNGRTEVLDLSAPSPDISGTVDVGTYPAYLAVDGTTGYVANATQGGSTPGSVSVLNLSDPSNPLAIATVAVGSHPYGIAALPALGEVLVSNSGDGTMQAIDATDDTKTSPISVGTTPDAVAVTPDQTTAIVSNEGDNTVTILHVNQPPSVSVPGSQTVSGNGPSSSNSLAFSTGNGDAISASDPDAGADPVQVTLSVAHGTLTLPSTSGLIFSAGSNGSDSMTFTGALSDINSDLDGLTYAPATSYTGPDPLSVSVNDQGNSGDIGTPQTASATVPISVQNVITAGNVSYTGAIGNTAFGVGTTPSSPSTDTSGTVLSNSSDVNGDSLTAVPGTITTTKGGTVDMNADGTFTYEPPASYTGNDTFTFQVTDGTTTSPATATVTVADMVWYVKNDDTGANDGRSTSPFHTLAQAQSASSAGDTIYIFHGDGTTAGQDAGITLKSSQSLVGAADDLIVGGATLASGNSANRPDIGNSSGSGVSLASGDTVEGLNIAANTSGAAISGGSGDSGGTISDDIVSGAGGAGGIVLSSSSGEFDISALSDSVIGSGPGLQDNSAGTITVTGSTNTLSTQTGDALDIESTTIGTAGATFQSISAGTTGAGPLYGIFLSNAGSGGLTVTGTGTTAGSGGTIQNSTSKLVNGTQTLYGNVVARTSGAISLSNMNLLTPADYNVAIGNATGLTLINNTITGAWNGNPAAVTDGGGVTYVVGAYASGSTEVTTPAGFDIANNTFNKTFSSGPIQIVLDTTQLVTGHITGNQLGTTSNKSTSNSGGIFLENDGNQVKADISGNLIYGTEQGNGIDALTEPGNYGLGGGSELDVNVTNNTVDDEYQAAEDAISVAASDGNGTSASTVCLNFANNNAKSLGLAADDGLASDASGAYLHNDYNSTVFKIAGGPNENAGANNEDTAVETYIDTQNTLSGPPGDQQSYVLQFGSAGFTNTSSCPQAPAVSLSKAAALTQKLSTRARRPLSHAQSAQRPTRRIHPAPERRRHRAAIQGRVRAFRRHQAAVRRAAARAARRRHRATRG